MHRANFWTRRMVESVDVTRATLIPTRLTFNGSTFPDMMIYTLPKRFVDHSLTVNDRIEFVFLIDMPVYLRDLFLVGCLR